MSNGINAVVPAANLTANLSTGARMSAQLTPGGIIMNDYRLTVSDIDGGKRLTVKRGAEVQEMDILNGAPGVSGVYVGPGDMPDGYNVQIDPDGSATDIVDLVLAALPNGDEVSY